MKWNKSYGIDIYSTRVKLQIVSFGLFIIFSVMLALQYKSNKNAIQNQQRIDVKTDIYCITEVCLNDDCIEVPGEPEEGEVMIVGDYMDKHTKHILIRTYPGHRCKSQSDE